MPEVTIPAVLAFLPAAFVLLFGFWCGTFPGGATAGGAIAGQISVLAALVLGADRWADPLRLGGWRRLAPQLLVIAVFASMFVSSVPRAGRAAALLLPAFLLVPAAVERALASESAKRLGLAALSAALAALAAAALVSQWRLGSPRAAMPLGHHNLLAGFLVTLLPAALLPLRDGGGRRALAGAAGLLAITAVLRSGSLLGVVALAVEAGLALLWWRRWHKLLLPCALLVLALQMPRAAAIFRGADPSTQARLVYLEAGWRGLVARPWLGWGPGSTGWTIARHMRPRPGINPPSEVVGDLHSLPMQILYELGAIGFLATLATAAIFLRRRIAERESVGDPALLAAGLIGMLGAATTRLGGAALSVTALPLAAAVAAGVALAAKPRRAESEPRWPAVVYAAVAAQAMVPLDVAQGLYDRAVSAASRGDEALALRRVEAAARWDPALPLYPARAAWLQAGTPGASARALAAAQAATSISALWLEAGVLLDSPETDAGRALEQACALDPLAAPAPFRLATSLAAREPATAARLAARALLAEPRLLAATFWQQHRELRVEALADLETWNGIDRGWRSERLAGAAASMPGGGPLATLGLEMDRVSARSLSLYAFRRRPWPATLAAIEVDAAAARRITLPPATTLPTSAAAAFPVSCDPGAARP
jgi:putative inorganic carbon (HCO3(-)) transporter